MLSTSRVPSIPHGVTGRCAWQRRHYTGRSCVTPAISRAARFRSGETRTDSGAVARRRSRRMAEGIKPIRRVVTGNDGQGRSKVLYDSAAPNVNANAFKKGTGMTDVWVFHDCPANVSGERDDGNLPFQFEPPKGRGHLRIVQSDPKPADA